MRLGDVKLCQGFYFNGRLYYKVPDQPKDKQNTKCLQLSNGKKFFEDGPKIEWLSSEAKVSIFVHPIEGNDACNAYYNNPATVVLLERKIKEAVARLQEAVCTEGVDKGVVMLSDEGRLKYNPETQKTEYQNEYFSDLGDALIKIYHLLTAPL